MLIRNDFYGKRWVYTSGMENTVNIPDVVMDEALLDKSKTFMLMHNHLTDSSFSAKDIQTFMNMNWIRYLFVITNSCRYIGAVGKTKVFDTDEHRKIWRHIFEFSAKHNLWGHDSGIPLIHDLHNLGLLEYIWFKNY